MAATKRKIPEARRSAIARDFAAGESTLFLARKYMVSRDSVRLIGRRAGIVRKKIFWDLERRRGIVDAYKRGLTIRAISAKFNVSITTIKNLRIEAGLPTRPLPIIYLSEETKTAILTAYMAGIKIEAIAAEYGVGRSVVSKFAKNANIPHRKKPAMSAWQTKQLLSAFRRGDNTKDIAARFGVTRAYVCRLALRNDVTKTAPAPPINPSKDGERLSVARPQTLESKTGAGAAL